MIVGAKVEAMERGTFDLVDVVRNGVLAAGDELASLVRTAVREELMRLERGDPDELIGAEAAAALLGMSVLALRRAAARGTAPVAPRRLGRRLRWRRGDLVAVARARSRATR